MSIKLFGFSTFYVFLDFLTQKQENIDKKKNNVKAFKKQMQTNKHKFSNQASITTKSIQQSKVTKHRKY